LGGLFGHRKQACYLYNVKLYHGTAGENVPAILKRGIRPRRVTGKNNWKHSVASHEHAVYLTSAYAGYYAHQAAKTSKLGIIEIDTDRLDQDLFRPDEDFLEQATRNGQTSNRQLKRLKKRSMNERTEWFSAHLDEFAHAWKDSVKHLGNCCYLGEIPPEAITRASVFDYKKNALVASELLEPTITIANFKFCSERYLALTRWLMGEDIDPDALLIVARSALAGMPREFRDAIAGWDTKAQGYLNNRSGLKIVKPSQD
jgi:hypothetical protein